MAKTSTRAAPTPPAGSLLYGDTRCRLRGLSPALCRGHRRYLSQGRRRAADEAGRMHKAADKLEKMVGKMFAKLEE